MYDRIDMDRVNALVNAAGVKSSIQHTGGGCWTIYAGDTHDEPGWGERWAAIAGPGWSTGTLAEGQHFYANPDDFYVGPDDDGDDLTISTVSRLGVTSDEDVAALIVAQARR